LFKTLDCGLKTQTDTLERSLGKATHVYDKRPKG